MATKPSNEDARRLRLKLTSDLQEGSLYPNCRGRIDRSHYLKVLKLQKSKDVVAVFDEFDDIARSRLEVSEADLVRIGNFLETALQNRNLALEGGRINRRFVERVFGFPPLAFDKSPAAELFLKFDHVVVEGDYRYDGAAVTALENQIIINPPPTRSPFMRRTIIRPDGLDPLTDRLSRALEEDFENGALPLNKYGRILRKSYSDRFNVSRSALNNCRHLFSAVERRSGGVASRYAALVPEVKAWFADELRRGTLVLNDDRQVSVRHIMDRFNLTRTTIKRTAAMVEAISWMNEEIIRLKYFPKAKLNVVQRLVAALPVSSLNKDGLTVNRKALIRAKVVKAHDLRDTSALRAIYEFEAKHREIVASDALKAIINDWVWDFSEFVDDGWPSDVAIAIRNAFAANSSELTTNKLTALRLASAFLFKYFSGKTTDAARAVFFSISSRHDLSPALWTQALLEVQALLENTVPDVSKKNQAGVFNRAIQIYADEGILPSAESRITLTGSEKKHGRKSLAELLPPVSHSSGYSAASVASRDNGSLGSASAEYVRFARWVLMQRETEGKQDEPPERFLEVLEQEFVAQGDSLPGDPVDAIINVLSRRLGLIHAAASRLFKRWQAHYQRGQLIRASGRFSPELVDVLFGDNRRGIQYSSALLEFFPVRQNLEQALANFLRLIQDRCSGIVPVFRPDGDVFFRNRIDDLRLSHADVQAFLVPHNDAVDAAIIMKMVETGANNAVCRTVFENEIEDADDLGYRKITGEKARAKGRPIYTHLPRTSEALKAIEWLKENRAVSSGAASPSQRDFLFHVIVRGKVTHPSPYLLGETFRKLIEGTDELRDLGITPGMIRTSVLLMDALTSQGDLRMGIARAHHDPAQASVYQINSVTRYIYDRRFSNFQKEVSRLIENIIEGVLTPSMKPTGTGGVCSVGGCAELKCWDSCPNFGLIADPFLLSQLLIWEEALNLAQPEWEQVRPERWNAVWLPHLEITRKLAERFRSSALSNSLKKKWKIAVAMAAERKASPDFAMPRPY